MSVMAETSQLAMGPYVAMAAVGSALYAWTAVFREALVVKVVGLGGGGDGGGGGGGGQSGGHFARHCEYQGSTSRCVLWQRLVHIHTVTELAQGGGSEGGTGGCGDGGGEGGGEGGGARAQTSHPARVSLLNHCHPRTM